MTSYTFRYLAREGVRNVRKNPLMSFASVGVLFACLLMVGVSFLLLVNIDAIIGNIEAQNVVMVYLQGDTPQEDAVQVGQTITSMQNVSACSFISKEDAFAEQIAQMGVDSSLFANIDENPLPDSYKVTIRSMEQFDQTVSQIESLPFVESTNGNRDLALQLASTRTTVTYVSVCIIGMLLLVALFIISNTVHITMFSRRQEIGIMKDVGATNSFIRWPFIIEGILLGLLASALSFFAVWGLYVVAAKSLSSLSSTIFGGSLVPFFNYAWILLLGFLLIGIGSGVFSSFFSTRKYVKEKEFVDIED